MILSSTSQPRKISIHGGENGIVNVVPIPVRQVILSQDLSGISRYSEAFLVETLQPIKFNLDYQIGSPANPVSGNIQFDLTNATIGSATSVFHQSPTQPTLGTNVDLALIGFTMSDYATNQLNEFLFVYMVDSATEEPYVKIYHRKNITIINSI